MNMKNAQPGLGALAALALAFAPLAATADLLYWMVDPNNLTWSESSGKTGTVAFEYASVRVEGASEPLHNFDQEGATEYWQLYKDEDNASAPLIAYSGSFDRNSVSRLKVEVWDLDDQLVGWWYYGVAEVSSYIWPEGSRPESGATPLAVTQMVPEPTSGMLVLLGLAGLALRRRRAV